MGLLLRFEPPSTRAADAAGDEQGLGRSDPRSARRPRPTAWRDDSRVCVRGAPGICRALEMPAREALVPASGATTVRSARRDGLAYATLEQARLGCERLIEHARTPPLAVLLRAAHRELGLAGYRASGELPATLRQHLHASAKWGAPESRAGVHSATEEVLMLTIRGTELTAELRADPGIGDEVPAAYFHALGAVSALAALVGAARAKALAAQATLAGELDPARVPAVLSSITAADRAAAHR